MITSDASELQLRGVFYLTIPRNYNIIVLELTIRRTTAWSLKKNTPETGQ
jgi:hypothetical protein